MTPKNITVGNSTLGQRLWRGLISKGYALKKYANEPMTKHDFDSAKAQAGIKP